MKKLLIIVAGLISVFFINMENVYASCEKGYFWNEAKEVCLKKTFLLNPESLFWIDISVPLIVIMGGFIIGLYSKRLSKLTVILFFLLIDFSLASVALYYYKYLSIMDNILTIASFVLVIIISFIGYWIGKNFKSKLRKWTMLLSKITLEVISVPFIILSAMLSAALKIDLKKHHGELLAFVVIVFLIVAAFGDVPYGYYTLNMVVVFSYFVYLLSKIYKESDNPKFWIFGITALIFNPLFPLDLGKEIWQIADLAAVAIIFCEKFLPKLKK